MARYKKEGAPTNRTKGMIGDVYEDVTTGKRYSCVSSYSDSMGTAEFEWREEIQSIDAEPIIDTTPESEPEPEKSVIDIPKQEPPKENRDQQRDRNRNNYQNYHNGHKTPYNQQYRPNSN